MVSLNDIRPSDKIPQWKTFVWKDEVWYMALFMIFGLLWLLAVVEYLSNFIVITSAATYYFNNKREVTETQNPADVGKAWKIAYFSHLGSVAFGGFIIAILRFIKYTFVYLSQKVEQATEGTANQALQCFFRCATCILECMETITDYINESAFCYIALTGDSFCTGALQTFLLKIRYLSAVAFSAWIAKVFMFMGKVAIIVGNCFSLKFIMTFITKDMEEISSLAGPMVVVALSTYIMASIFLGMFDETVNSMLTCVGIDTNANDGVPIYGPETFNNRLSTDEDGAVKLKTTKKKSGIEEEMLDGGYRDRHQMV